MSNMEGEISGRSWGDLLENKMLERPSIHDNHILELLTTGNAVGNIASKVTGFLADMKYPVVPDPK